MNAFSFSFLFYILSFKVVINSRYTYDNVKSTKNMNIIIIMYIYALTRHNFMKIEKYKKQRTFAV